MNLAALKTLARHHAAPSLLGAGMAALDYRGRRAAGEGVLPSVAQAAFWNIAPAIMFAGPYALPLEIAFSMLPAIPGAVKAASMVSSQRESYIRSSALPFSTYGHMPTAGAMAAMQFGMKSMNRGRNLSQTHAALHAQALRR